MKLSGKIWKVGKNVDTDVILPGRYCTITDTAELGKHCLEGLDPGFVKKISPGDILIADTNFGCGSSRELAPLAIKGCGIACVVAGSFARIFYRNAINIGLPILECAQAYSQTNEQDQIEIDLSTGIIRNLTQGKTLQAQPFPPFIQEIIQAGGLVNKTIQNLQKAKKGVCG